jgi:acyl carrier protein
MISVDRVRQTVFKVLDELNEQLPAGQHLAKADTTALVGESGGLDSLGLVNLVALVEQHMEADFQTSIILIDDDVMSEASTHFADVASLTRYLASILEGHVDG